MSHVVWVDEQDNVLGAVERQKAHAEGLRHRISVIFLVNEQGEVLVNERAKDGLLDHSSAGHLDPGESYLNGAKRKLKEELGVEAELTDIGHGESRDYRPPLDGRHFFKVYVAHAKPVAPDPTEVKHVYWADPQKILVDMTKNPDRYTEGFKASLPIFLNRPMGNH
ncbi:MAG TPA: NUDIX domain-containing protein [Candidatus Paceibacterota bacterium]|nr:NUDIX domain-containing protein [Candidatus Paceibacterota bacterium]